MRRNVGKMDRLFRGLRALGLLTCAWVAPLPLAARLSAFGLAGVGTPAAPRARRGGEGG
ncbi:hypothetical protein WME79_27645 [Sorangium sp. So ce726]|uniref:hypothetical protein n=1 Tax=Sorangium sp. So ce726 TaxID=3133319 RepID=UPI003F5DE493